MLHPHPAINLPGGEATDTQKFFKLAIEYWGGEPSMGDVDEMSKHPEEFCELLAVEKLVFIARVKAWAEGAPATTDEAGARAEAAALQWVVGQIVVTVDMLEEDSKADNLEIAQALQGCAREYGIKCPEEVFSNDTTGWTEVVEGVAKNLAFATNLNGRPQVYADEYILAAFSLGVMWAVISQLGDMKYEKLDPQRTTYRNRSHYRKVSAIKSAWLKKFFSRMDSDPLPSLHALSACFPARPQPAAEPPPEKKKRPKK